MKKLNLVDVDISYESGCDSLKMLDWLQSREGHQAVRETDFLLISLGTNDVGRYGVEVALQRSSELIQYIRQSFPRIQAIGWLALSPRWKPTRFVSAAEIGQLHDQFNEHLHILSSQLDFDVVDARLRPSDMRVEDGLHPSTTTGRWKIEGTLREWFAALATSRVNPALQQQQRTITHHHEEHNNNNHYNRRGTHYNAAARVPFDQYQQRNNNNNQYVSRTNQNSTQPFQVTTVERTTERAERTAERTVERTTTTTRLNIPTRSLIKFYPHKIRTQEQYFRENEPPKEIEKNKEKLFLAANHYYQMKHFEEEHRKWKIYEQIANRKEQPEREDIEMIDVEEIPLARPMRERYSAILNMTLTDSDSHKDKDSSDSSSRNDSDTEEEDKKKRKLHETSLSPKDQDKTTNIGLRKKKEKNKKKKRIPIENDPRAPSGSPILILNETRQQIAAEVGVEAAATTTTVITKRPDTPSSPTAKRQRLFTHIIKPQRTQRIRSQRTSPELPATPPGLPSQPVVSPRQSTPRAAVTSPTTNSRISIIGNSPKRIEQTVTPMEQETVRQASPSAISKDIGLASIDLFNFPIIPIECKFHFQTFHLRANAENITAHRQFLEKKAAQQEEQLEQILKQFDKNMHSTVVEYIRKSVEPLIDSLKQSNQKRIDNLVLDQMKEKALRTIKAKCKPDSLEQIDKAQEKFERTLQLRLQLDKLDKRFNENMPPPALNIIDKLQFRSRELDQQAKEQYSEQWNSVIRKTKLELTSIMRLAKTAEIDKIEKEHQTLLEQIPIEVRSAYKELIHTVKIRLDRAAAKKINFLDRKATRMNTE